MSIHICQSFILDSWSSSLSHVDGEYEHTVFPGGLASSSSFEPERTDSKPVGVPVTSPPVGVTAVPVTGDPAVADLLGFGEESPIIQLRENPQLGPEEFERQWRSLPRSESLQLTLSALPSPEELEQTMTAYRISTMASSPPDQPIAKFYFYAQQAETEMFFFIETVIDTRSHLMTSSFKCADAALLSLFKEHFKKSLVGKWMPLDF